MSKIWADYPALTPHLIKLWNDELSAAACAVILQHGLTRSAVVAKIDRLRKAGVELRRAQLYPAKPPIHRAPRIVTAPPVPIEHPGSMEPIRLEDGEFVTAANARDSHCRYGYGEPQNSDFRYCGRPIAPGRSFCPAHAKLCYQPLHAPKQSEEEAVA